jgi:Uma2 family endonuclease
MQTQTPKTYYTPEEYLQLEEKSEFKNEYRDGEIVPMTGGTTNHNEIALNYGYSQSMSQQSQQMRCYHSNL